jgi:multidrug efflux pump subunit AcrA (membrane-fusion protein)
MKKHIYTTLILGTIALVSCSKEEKSIENQDAPIAVTLSNTTFSNTSYATASGKLVSKNSVNVSTRMMGYITSLRAEVGQHVSAGQTLVSINNTDIQAKGGQASANIAQAQANFNIAKKTTKDFKIYIKPKCFAKRIRRYASTLRNGKSRFTRSSNDEKRSKCTIQIYQCYRSNLRRYYCQICGTR